MISSKEPFGFCPWLDGLAFNRISREKREGLEQPFQIEEVLTTLHSLKEDKVLGPDGFPLRFYVNFWDIIRADVMEVLREFHENSSWCCSLSASFISLVPKKKRSGGNQRLQTDQCGGQPVQSWLRFFQIDWLRFWGM